MEGRRKGREDGVRCSDVWGWKAQERVYEVVLAPEDRGTRMKVIEFSGFW